MFADKPVGLIALDFNRIGPDFMGAIDQIAAFMHRTVVIGTYLADNVRRFADADASIGYFHGFSFNASLIMAFQTPTKPFDPSGSSQEAQAASTIASLGSRIAAMAARAMAR